MSKHPQPIGPVPEDTSRVSGVASKELGRFFVGAEKEEEYAELAARRIGASVRGGVLGEIEEARPGV
jgi:site-specific DNA-methyltransferase (adenine-specific)